MPYISQEKRAELEPVLGPLLEVSAGLDDGEVNYVLTSVIHAWLSDRPRYADYARAIAALECAKLELYRDQVAQYEDQAKVWHGPVA